MCTINGMTFRATPCICIYIYIYIYIYCSATQRGSWSPHSWGFLDHTQRRTTVGRVPLDEWTARRRDLYLTTHNTHNRQIFMPPVGFELTISAGERPQNYALDRAATGTGVYIYRLFKLSYFSYSCFTRSFVFYIQKFSRFGCLILKL